MSSAKGFLMMQAVETASESTSIARLFPELARRNFHTLLQANPAYFSSPSESRLLAILKIHGNTQYKSIDCMGDNPDMEQLRAALHINRYDGGIPPANRRSTN